MTKQSEFDAIVVGAGFAGMYMLYRLRELGLRTRVLETASDVGGTWYWNRYPGARCDVESLNYSYSFDEELQQEWHWTERFAAQPEILAYARHVADRFDLRSDIDFNTKVEQASFDGNSNRWRIRCESGRQFLGRWLIMASGCLSLPKVPDFKGLDRYDGRWFHTGRWPREPVSFAGEKVGVIGTGASGIQVVPVVAEEADKLFVFQRTASYSLPARNMPIDREYEAGIKSRYAEYRKEALETVSGVVREKMIADSPFSLTPEEREAAFESLWQKGGTGFLKAFGDLGVNRKANDIAADFIRRKIRKKVKNPATADLLASQTDPVGTRRVTLDTHYFETFNRENVTLVDVKSDPIVEITERGVRTTNAEYPVDSLIFATGYDAITGPLLDIDIRGRAGLSLSRKWKEGPTTYLGLMTSDFPNLFTITGPGSPSVLTNMIASIEQHVDFISSILEWARERGAIAIEASPQAEAEWVRHVNEVASKTLHVTANSWYRGVNVPGKPQIFMPYVGGFHNYRRHCLKVKAEGFPGFELNVPPEDKAAAS